MNVLNLVLLASKRASGKHPKDETFKEMFLDSRMYELEEGVSYIVKEKRNVKGMKLFTNMIAKGYNGLYITRQHPDHVNRTYEVNGMEIVWLSSTIGKDNVEPQSLTTIFSRIKAFVEKNEKSIIILDGMEYLMISNAYNRLLKFIEMIKEIVVKKNSIFLISLDERAFESKEISLLEKWLKPIET